MIITHDRKEYRDIWDYLQMTIPEKLKIHSHTSILERCALYDLALKLPPGSDIFELGTHLGATACVLGLAAGKNKLHVNCVDTFDSRAMNGKEPLIDTSSAWIENTGWDKNNICVFSMTTGHAAHKVKEDISEYQIRMIFFDADHSYEGIAGDIKAWLPLCMKGATLAFHDYGGRYGRPAIQKAVQELIWPVQDGPGHVFQSLYWCTLGGAK